MSNEYVSPYFLLILWLGVLALADGQLSCRALTDKCYEDALKTNDLTQNDVTRILNEWKKTRNPTKEDKEKICKMEANKEVCYAKLKGQCGDDIFFIKETTGSELVARMFNCQAVDPNAECNENVTGCAVFGAMNSTMKITHYVRLRNATLTDRKYLIGQIGRAMGCAAVENFTACDNTINDKCGNAPGQGNDRDTMEQIRTIYQCGQPNAMTKCEESFNKCKKETMGGDMENKMNDIIWKSPEASIQFLISLIKQNEGCQFVKDFQPCYEKVKTQCDQDDIFFKPILDINKLIPSQLECQNWKYCSDQRDKCNLLALTEGRVSSNQLDQLLAAAASGNSKQFQTMLDQIGKEKGCKFAEVYNDCYDGVKRQCTNLDPPFKPFLELAKTMHGQLHCGCASTVASLILILASIFLIFNRNICFH